MSPRVRHPHAENPHVERELDAMVIERSGWIAQLTSERARCRDIASQRLDVRAQAVELRGHIRVTS